jgi:predicted GNAT superfamily acetyltransferase
MRVCQFRHIRKKGETLTIVHSRLPMVLHRSDKCDIRILQTHAEFSAAVELQRVIWGFDPIDLLPVRFFVVASKIGGQVLGAFEGSRMVGFCLCIPGIKPSGFPYLHSHMLGLLPEYRNRGLGRRMKLLQREFALSEGVELIEWTFDPLERKNAFLNIERLGCIVRRYVYNQYGMTSSRLHGGLPTDRLIAEWWIKDSRNRPPSEEAIGVPNAIGELRRSNPQEARKIQAAIASQFDQAFTRGLTVVGFEPGEDESRYLLAKYSPEK